MSARVSLLNALIRVDLLMRADQGYPVRACPVIRLRQFFGPVTTTEERFVATEMLNVCRYVSEFSPYRKEALVIDYREWLYK